MASSIAVRSSSISAEYSLERIAMRLGDDIARLRRQLSVLEAEPESVIRANTQDIYADMLAKRLALLAEVESELASVESEDYQAVAL